MCTQETTYLLTQCFNILSGGADLQQLLLTRTLQSTSFQDQLSKIATLLWWTDLCILSIRVACPTASGWLGVVLQKLCKLKHSLQFRKATKLRSITGRNFFKSESANVVGAIHKEINDKWKKFSNNTIFTHISGHSESSTTTSKSSTIFHLINSSSHEQYSSLPTYCQCTRSYTIHRRPSPSSPYVSTAVPKTFYTFCEKRQLWWPTAKGRKKTTVTKATPTEKIVKHPP